MAYGDCFNWLEKSESKKKHVLIRTTSSLETERRKDLFMSDIHKETKKTKNIYFSSNSMKKGDSWSFVDTFPETDWMKMLC